MKKIALLLFTVFALFSCSISDDDKIDYHVEVLPIESFSVPTSFDMNKTYPITVRYKRPTDCHYYTGIYYEKNADSRIFGIQTTVLNNTDCAPLDDEPIEVTFDFQCTPGNDHYLFKFYKGEDENGNNIFEEVNIPVTY